MKVIHNERDITEYVSSISWGGSRSEVARKLDLKVINAPMDKNITPLTMGLADLVYLLDDDNTELFRGFITDREASSATGTVTYVAYDLLYYTNKSNATYNFSNTAEGITKMVCDDMEIPVGSLAVTGLPQKLIVQDKSIYEIIMQAYTQVHSQNGKSYYVTAKNGLLNVEEIGSTVCEIELTDDNNITASKYSETINNMVNTVRIYDGEGNQTGVVQNSSDLQYGIFQKVYTQEEGKDPATVAKSKFNGVEKTFTFECINHNGAVTGAGAVVRDSTTGLAGLVWIDSDTHTWTNGVATMSLTVTLKKMMDTKEVSGESSIWTEAENSGTGGSSSATTPTYGSKDNPPYKVVNQYYRPIKEGISKWDVAFTLFVTNGGDVNGWHILDKDNKEVLVESPAGTSTSTPTSTTTSTSSDTTDKSSDKPTKNTSPYGSKDNPPYAIYNRDRKLIKGNFLSYNKAYIYYLQNGGRSYEGKSYEWYIIDGDKKEVIM